MVLQQESINQSIIKALEDIAKESPGKFQLNINVKTSQYDYLQITPQKFEFFPGTKFNNRLKELFSDQTTVSVMINETP